MTVKEHPCAQGLTPECFAEEPVWAKKAFAYRLLCMLMPPSITRRLQRFLVDASIFPGTLFPPGFVLPPGWTIPPGWQFPHGWKIGDPMPYGLLPPGVNWDDPPPGSLSASPFLAVWQPAPNRISAISPTGEVTHEIYGSTGDGHVHIARSVWSDAHGALSGSSFNITDTQDSDCIIGTKAGISYIIRRAFFSFDLSSISASKTVISVSLFIHGYVYADNYVCVQKSYQADNLSVNDFSRFTGTYFKQQAWAVDDNLLAFNALGISYIQSVLASTAKLCLRDYYNDYLDVIPTTLKRQGCCFADHLTFANRPRLIIVYK